MPATQQRQNSTSSSSPPEHRILLTNGRFPVSLELARQFRLAGYVVYCVDPMSTHICTFSIAVRQSAQIPAPHMNPKGYIRAIKELTIRWEIDMIIPVHEEVFCLADSNEPEIISRLFAPPFGMLVRLHDKYEFTKYMEQLGLLVPRAYLCKSTQDVMQLPVDRYPDGMALKACFGRVSSGLTSGIYHLKPGEPIPEDLDCSEEKWFVAQAWLVGNRYCSYSAVRNGLVEATGCYPVPETIDGSGSGSGSSVLFRQKFHPGVYDYIHQFVASVPAFSGQIAFDFIETSHGLYALECKPQATPGLHLWANTPWLVRAITGTLPKEDIERPIRPPKQKVGHEPHHHVSAGMLMWGKAHKNATFGVWAKQMKRMMFTRDVVWKWRDPFPVIAQPFLLTEYYRISHRAGQPLPEMFQEQLVWEPRGDELEAVRDMFSMKQQEDPSSSSSSCSITVGDSAGGPDLSLQPVESWATRTLTIDDDE